MEDKNELSDIVLEKEDGKTLKAKRILVIVALLIVVFLIVIVLFKIQSGKSTVQGPQLNLPPEPTATQVISKEDENLFKKVEIQEEVEDKKESFEEMVKSLKAKEQQKQVVVEEKVEEKIVEPIKQAAKIATKAKPKKVATITPPKKAITATSVPSLATKGVYIQVGATSKVTPDKKFLAQIASKKYSYKLFPIDIKGTKVTKILIGPYETSTEARNVMADVKSDINKDAFIYRVK